MYELISISLFGSAIFGLLAYVYKNNESTGFDNLINSGIKLLLAVSSIFLLLNAYFAGSAIMAYYENDSMTLDQVNQVLLSPVTPVGWIIVIFIGLMLTGLIYNLNKKPEGED